MNIDRARRGIGLALLLASATACGPTPTANPPVGATTGARSTTATTADANAATAPAGSSAATSAPAPKSYRALFDDLATKIERDHVFADVRKPGWPRLKALLAEEFDRVTTREEALIALYHLQNALGDRHCSLSPPTDLRQQRLAVGLALFAESKNGVTVVRVDEVLDKELAQRADGGVAEGDQVVAVDGVPVADWLAARPFESNSLNAEVALAEQVNAIVATRLPWSTVKKGDTRKLRLRRGAEEREVALSFVHPSKWEDADDINLDHAPAMSSVGCRQDKHPLYTGFELATVGTNLCVYRPTSGKRDTRLVRFLSFRYNYNGPGDDLRAVKADHDLLLRELGRAKAVVLDLHENRGGNNPFVFLSWFAAKPWDHQQVHVRVSPDFSEDDVRQFLFGDGPLVARYREAAARGRKEETWPFLCQRDGKNVTSGVCEAQGPRESERVTRAPIAVVTGPDCTSSCDSFVTDWAAFAMGPLVGLQPAHGFTTVRHSYPLIAPDGRDLGRFKVALSWEGYPRSGTALEGAPVKLDWEAPYGFETRRTWIDLAVNEARRLAERAPAPAPAPRVAERR